MIRIVIGTIILGLIHGKHRKKKSRSIWLVDARVGRRRVRPHACGTEAHESDAAVRTILGVPRTVVCRSVPTKSRGSTERCGTWTWETRAYAVCRSSSLLEFFLFVSF